MKCSIVIATKNKAEYLRPVLQSIREQQVPFDYETIVVDDGSTDDTRRVCEAHDAFYIHLHNPGYRNPAIARNVGYHAAVGDIIIAQSDDVIHKSEDTIERLVTELQQGEYLLATVWHCDGARRVFQLVPGRKKRNVFFLGSLWRRDLYAVGGNDEDFTMPGSEDSWFADCLIHGLGLKCRYLPTVEAIHQAHPQRPAGKRGLVEASKRLWKDKFRRAKRGEISWCSAGGPWKYA